MRRIALLLLLWSFDALAGTTSLTVSAAASLRAPLEEIRKTFETTHSDIRVVFNFGSSGSLQHQITNGAPVDIFISAAVPQMDRLEKEELLLAGSRRTLLKNRIVLIAPAGSRIPSGFDSLKDPAVGHIAIGEPESVPAGMYAMEVFRHLQLAGDLSKRLVFAKDVRQVLVYVESENAGAGIVYASDAKSSTAVRIVAEAPTGSHTPVEYPAAILAASRHPREAADFLSFLTTPTALDVFQAFGFEPVTP